MFILIGLIENGVFFIVLLEIIWYWFDDVEFFLFWIFLFWRWVLLLLLILVNFDVFICNEFILCIMFLVDEVDNGGGKGCVL